MARIRDFYGFEFDSDDLALNDCTLARIVWAARNNAVTCNGIGDFAAAYADLEKAARNLLALRALHHQVELVRSGRF
jgi:hypothetical protein